MNGKQRVRFCRLMLLTVAGGSLVFGVRLAGQSGPANAQAGQATAPASSAPSRPSIINPKAQQLLDRTIQALGGPAFLSFKTLTTHGRLFSLEGGEAGGGFVYFDSQVQYPDKRRLSYGLGKKGKPIVVVNNSDQGWEIDRMGMMHLESDEISQWRFANRYSLENLLRLRIHEPGALVQAAGSDFVDNVVVDILDIVDAQQTQVKLYLAKQTGLPTQISYRKWNSTTQDWDEYSDTYSDYRPFQGIMTPMHITRSLNGQRVAEIYRSAALYNDAYPPELFIAPG
jgi:hypothetical protein